MSCNASLRQPCKVPSTHFADGKSEAQHGTQIHTPPSCLAQVSPRSVSPILMPPSFCYIPATLFCFVLLVLCMPGTSHKLLFSTPGLWLGLQVTNRVYRLEWWEREMLRPRDPGKPHSQEPSLVLLYSSCWVSKPQQDAEQLACPSWALSQQIRQLTKSEEAQVSWLWVGRRGSKHISLPSPRMSALETWLVGK